MSQIPLQVNHNTPVNPGIFRNKEDPNSPSNLTKTSKPLTVLQDNKNSQHNQDNKNLKLFRFEEKIEDIDFDLLNKEKKDFVEKRRPEKALTVFSSEEGRDYEDLGDLGDSGDEIGVLSDFSSDDSDYLAAPDGFDKGKEISAAAGSKKRELKAASKTPISKPTSKENDKLRSFEKFFKIEEIEEVPEKSSFKSSIQKSKAKLKKSVKLVDINPFTAERIAKSVDKITENVGKVQRSINLCERKMFPSELVEMEMEMKGGEEILAKVCREGGKVVSITKISQRTRNTEIVDKLNSDRSKSKNSKNLRKIRKLKKKKTPFKIQFNLDQELSQSSSPPTSALKLV